ncbi:MAG: hypothetical protein CMH53_06105 [Myxococcales bacterium]|nr:hypothetical protein [Myxococcales bacterium]
MPAFFVCICILVGASALLGPIAAGIRYVTSCPSVWALMVATLSYLVGGWRLYDRLAGKATWTDALISFICLVSSALLVRAAMAAPGFEGLPTIGGGDAGNHLALAGAWATQMPQVYAGFSGLYALLFAVDQGWRHDLLRSLHDVHRAGLTCAVFFALLCIWRPLRDATGGRKWFGACAALTSGVLIWPSSIGLVSHYLQIDGFLPQNFALAPLLATTAAVVWVSDRVSRTLAICVGLVLLRFTYGLQLGDALLGAALLCGLNAVKSPQRLAWSGLSFAMFCAACVVWWQLVIRRSKTGGVQHFSPHLITLGLLALSAALLPLLRQVKHQADAACQRVSWWSLGLIAPSLVMGAMTWTLPDAQRGYYLWKYPFTAVAMSGLVAPALLTMTCVHAWRTSAAAIVGTVVLLATGAWGASQIPLANPSIEQTWQERRGAEVSPRRLQPLVDRHLLAFAQRDLNASKPHRQLLALAHDQWALYNATWSLLHPWQMPPIARAVDLQTKRFPAFQNGATLRKGGCVVWSETPQRVQSVLRRAIAQRSPLARRLRAWRRDPQRRCETYTPHWAAWVLRGLAEEDHGHTHHNGPHLPLQETVCVLCR